MKLGMLTQLIGYPVVRASIKFLGIVVVQGIT